MGDRQQAMAISNRLFGRGRPQQEWPIFAAMPTPHYQRRHFSRRQSFHNICFRHARILQGTLDDRAICFQEQAPATPAEARRAMLIASPSETVSSLSISSPSATRFRSAATAGARAISINSNTNRRRKRGSATCQEMCACRMICAHLAMLDHCGIARENFECAG